MRHALIKLWRYKLLLFILFIVRYGSLAGPCRLFIYLSGGESKTLQKSEGKTPKSNWCRHLDVYCLTMSSSACRALPTCRLCGRILRSEQRSESGSGSGSGHHQGARGRLVSCCLSASSLATRNCGSRVWLHQLRSHEVIASAPCFVRRATL